MADFTGRQERAAEAARERARDERRKDRALQAATYDEIAGAEALRERARDTHIGPEGVQPGPYPAQPERPRWRFDVGHRVKVCTPPDRPLLAREGEVGTVTEVSRHLGSPDRYDYRVRFAPDDGAQRLYLESELVPAGAVPDDSVAGPPPFPAPEFDRSVYEETKRLLSPAAETPDLPEPGDVEGALAWLESCRETHVGWTVDDVLLQEEGRILDPEGTVAFHEETAAGYERVLETLRDALEEDGSDEECPCWEASECDCFEDSDAALDHGPPTFGDVVEEVRALNERLDHAERRAVVLERFQDKHERRLADLENGLTDVERGHGDRVTSLERRALAIEERLDGAGLFRRIGPPPASPPAH